MWIPCQNTSQQYHPTHILKREFALGNIAFEVKPRIFSNPVLYAKLMTLFEVLCLELDVAYAAILKGGGIDASWLWWKGLPQMPQHTVCIGAAYSAVWPEFVEMSKPIGSHHRCVTTDRFGKTPSPPPSRLTTVNAWLSPEKVPIYAEIFPFDFKYDDKKYVW